MRGFETYLKRPHISFVEDAPYRDSALELCFSSALRGHSFSMVDCLIRLILEDINVKVGYLATFNHVDFIDICQKRQIEIL